jgi:hypothetical protein
VTANVRCADEYGCRRYTDRTGVACMQRKDTHIEGDFDLVRGHRYKPCGWEGERPGRPTKIKGEVHWNILTTPNDPCPECGGQVELIPVDAEE